jgi:hypothetical protein
MSLYYAEAKGMPNEAKRRIVIIGASFASWVGFSCNNRTLQSIR